MMYIKGIKNPSKWRSKEVVYYVNDKFPEVVAIKEDGRYRLVNLKGTASFSTFEDVDTMITLSNHYTNGASKIIISKAVDQSNCKTGIKNRYEISLGGCGEGLDTGYRERERRGVEIGEEPRQKSKGLCIGRRVK